MKRKEKSLQSTNDAEALTGESNSTLQLLGTDKAENMQRPPLKKSRRTVTKLSKSKAEITPIHEWPNYFQTVRINLDTYLAPGRQS